VRGGILRLDKVGCALVHCCVQVIDFHKNPMRYPVVVVPAMVICVRWKVASEWIDPGTRTDLALVAI
jgi:hypothetical protein